MPSGCSTISASAMRSAASSTSSPPDFDPKPALAGYRVLLQRHAVDARTRLMIEDIASNLAPAAALGMTTAWVRSALDWAAAERRERLHPPRRRRSRRLSRRRCGAAGSRTSDRERDRRRDDARQAGRPVCPDPARHRRRIAPSRRACRRAARRRNPFCRDDRFCRLLPGSTGWPASASSMRRSRHELADARSRAVADDARPVGRWRLSLISRMKLATVIRLPSTIQPDKH